MNLDQFTVFAAVARYRSVTRASEELHISQPAVTKHLRLLQERYDSEFYRRRGRGIELTEAGRIFFRDARAILKLHDRLKDKLHAASSREQETLTTGASYSHSTSLLPMLLARFKKRHPQVQIDFRTADRAGIERMILNSEIELAVVSNPISNNSLVLEPYRREPVAIFVSGNHPLAKKRKVTWKDLEQIPFIVRKRFRGVGTADRLFESMRKSGLKPKVAMRCSSPEAVKAAVKRKIGAGISFKRTIAPEERRGDLKTIKLPGGNFEGQSFIVYRKGGPLSPNAQEFLVLLRKERPQ